MIRETDSLKGYKAPQTFNRRIPANLASSLREVIYLFMFRLGVEKNDMRVSAALFFRVKDLLVTEKYCIYWMDCGRLVLEDW